MQTNKAKIEEIQCAAHWVEQYRAIFKANNTTHEQAKNVLTEEDYKNYINCITILRNNQLSKSK